MIDPTLNILTLNNNYPIFVGEKLLDQPQLLNHFIRGNQVFLITDNNVSKHYLQKILDGLQTQ